MINSLFSPSFSPWECWYYLSVHLTIQTLPYHSKVIHPSPAPYLRSTATREIDYLIYNSLFATYGHTASKEWLGKEYHNVYFLIITII